MYLLAGSEVCLKVMPVVEVRAVIDMAISVAHAAATEDRRGTKAAAMDRKAAASEPAAMERGAAASESTAMKRRAAAMEATTAVKTTATVEAATMTTTAATPANLGRQPVANGFH